MIRPPDWMEAALRLLLDPVAAETVSGDLLEEYRESIYPKRGKRRADLWFLRQILGFTWRSSCGPILILAPLFIGRFVLDTFAPPAAWGPRSAFTTWSAIAAYVVIGFWVARKTRHVMTGTAIAVATHLIAHALNAAVALILFFLVIRHDTEMQRLFYMTGGWGEMWELPLILLPAVAVLGSIGGLAAPAVGWFIERKNQG
jgi:hypothetical protein